MGPDTVFLPVLEESLMFTRHLSGERNVGELLVVKTVRYDQVVPIANLTHLSIPVRVRGTGKPRGLPMSGCVSSGKSDREWGGWGVSR